MNKNFGNMNILVSQQLNSESVFSCRMGFIEVCQGVDSKQNYNGLVSCIIFLIE